MGDIGYYDEDGRFYFVQRLKEMIKCMDNQVVPAELEQLLLQEHSVDIAEVTVVGLPHPLYREAPAAAVVPRGQYMCHKAAGPLADKMKATITGKLAIHKHLYGGVFLFDSLPKTEKAKVNRRAIVEQCAHKVSL
ncbi:hypothetical protein MRX96_026629 [Rhipicephalus microplus]